MSEASSTGPTHPSGSGLRGRASAALVVGIMLLGAALRAKDFFSSRSLWFDEAMLGLNVVSRGYAALLKPLDFSQAAPPGFLLLEKTATYGLGDTDTALRLVPFLASLLALPVFYLLARRILGYRAAVISLLLLAVSPSAILYATEAKQYQLDLLATLVVLLSAAFYREGRHRWAALAVLAVAGSIAPLFSHAAMFVVAGVGIAVMIWESADRRWSISPGLALVVFIVAGAGFTNALLVLLPLSRNSFLSSFWEYSFPPFPPRSGDEWFLAGAKLAGLFAEPLGVEWKLFAAALFVLGLVSLAIHGKSFWAGAILLPLILAVEAAVVDVYPFAVRFFLFTLPFLALGVVSGLEAVLSARDRRLRWIGGVTALVLLAGTGARSILAPEHWRPREHQEMKRLLDFVKARLAPEDAIYVYAGAEPAFRFYAGWDPDYAAFQEHCVVVDGSHPADPGRRGRRDLRVSALHGHRRAWLIFSPIVQGMEERTERVLHSFDSAGRQINLRREPGVSAHLYELDSTKSSVPG